MAKSAPDTEHEHKHFKFDIYEEIIIIKMNTNTIATQTLNSPKRHVPHARYMDIA
jgi:hypothetical protein